MKKLLTKLINNPNTSPAFNNSADEEKHIYCYCGGVMQPDYSHMPYTIILKCNRCGKTRVLNIDLSNNDGDKHNDNKI